MAFDKAVQLNSNLIGLIPGYTARNDIFQRLNHPESNVRLEAINYIKSQDKLCKVSNNNNYDSGYKILDKAEPHCTNGYGTARAICSGKATSRLHIGSSKTDHTHAKKTLLRGSL